VVKSRGTGKGKGTAVLIHTMKAYRGRRGMALLIFNHGTSRSDEPHAPVVLSPPKKNHSTHQKGGCVAASVAPAEFESLTVQPIA